MSRSLIYHTQLTTNGTVSVESESGSVSTQLDAVSKSGIVLHCDHQALANIFPKTPSLSPKQSVKLDVDFGLPEVGRVTTTCDVVSLRRLSRDTFELQMNFAELNDRAVRAVEHYVERQLRISQNAKVTQLNTINLETLSSNEEKVRHVA